MPNEIATAHPPVSRTCPNYTMPLTPVMNMESSSVSLPFLLHWLIKTGTSSLPYNNYTIRCFIIGQNTGIPGPSGYRRYSCARAARGRCSFSPMEHASAMAWMESSCEVVAALCSLATKPCHTSDQSYVLSFCRNFDARLVRDLKAWIASDREYVVLGITERF